MRLEQEDMDLLEQLGSVLGRYDVGTASGKALEIAGARLESQRAAAAAQRVRLGRVYGVLGLTAGLFLVILLI